MGLWLGVYSYLLTYLLLPGFLDLLLQGGLTAPNYQGRRIPEGGGIVILVAAGLSIISTLPFYGPRWEREVLVFLFLLTAIGFLGFLDDSLAPKGVKGLGGHLCYFYREGRLDTGLLKALGGISSAFLVSWILSNDIRLVFLNGLLVSLSINVLNLLDLRPGRAGKAFLMIMLFIFWHKAKAGPLFLLYAVIGAVLAYLPLDLQGRVMLGDTGANVLGAVVGMALLWSRAPALKAIVVIFMLFLHLFCEVYSLGKAIEGIPLLSSLDRIGRRES